MADKAKLPGGIPYIIGNEAAERFSYYGMKTILVVFMTDYLMMTDAESTRWLHSFTTATYALPFIGALLADIFLGKYKTILTLSIVYCLGHLVLAINETQDGLFWGLTLIAIGSGGIKPCVSAHVGDQFTRSNSGLIDKVFHYFYLSINAGSLLSTLATPLLLKNFGPSVAFGIPGALMFLATFVFWLGRKEFVHIPPSGINFLKTAFNKNGLKVILRLSFVYLFVIFFWSLFDQTGSTWVLQAKSRFLDKQFSLFGYEFELLPSQIQAANPFLILLLVPLFTHFFYPALNRHIRLTQLRKVNIGLFIAGLSFVIVGWIESSVFLGEPVSVGWQLLAYFILTAAEVMVSITALEFSYTQAPNEMKSFVMSLFLISIAMGNLVTTGVNQWMVEEVSVKEVVTGEETKIYFGSLSNMETGAKIDFNKANGLQVIKEKTKKKVTKKDTSDLKGTYLIGEVDQATSSAVLWNIDRESVHTIGKLDVTAEKPNVPAFSTYKLKGADYFYFFAILMGVVAFLFIFVSENFKERHYYQED